jgi:hypothetical protein
VALIGGAIAFAATETIGLAAAIWPASWLGLFGDDPLMLATGSAYLRQVGPTFGFLRSRPLALLRLAGRRPAVLAAALGPAAAAGRDRRRWAVWSLTGSIGAVFAALGAGLVIYGVLLGGAVAAGAWFRPLASWARW